MFAASERTEPSPMHTLATAGWNEKISPWFQQLIEHGLPDVTWAAVETFEGEFPCIAGGTVPAQTMELPEWAHAPFMKVGCGVYIDPKAQPWGRALCSATMMVLLKPSEVSVSL